MKREELKALDVSDEVIESIMKLHGKTVESKKAENETLKAELESYKSQISDVTEKLKGFEDMNIDEIKNASSEIKTKYEQETKELKERLEKQAYTFKAKEFLSKYNYTNDLVKEAIENKFLSKDFKLDGEKFLGADDFMKELQETQKSAFITDEDNNKPSFGTATSKETTGNDDVFLKKWTSAIGL